MWIEQHLPAAELSHPSANFFARSNVHRDKSNRGRDSLSGGRGPNCGRGQSFQGRGRDSFFPPNQPPTSSPICQLCDKLGHTSPRYYSRFYQNFQNYTSTTPQAFYSSPSLTTDEEWYPYTSATHHLTNDVGNLNLNFEEYVGTNQIRVKNGSSLFMTHM